MKIVIAIDSLKGSLSSYEAGTAIKEGILRACPQDTVVVRPLADGGEGTVDALVEGLHGEKKILRVHGPLTDDVTCKYGIIAHEGKAILEMAEAAGLNQVPAHLRNPLYTTTYGVGQVIAQAISDGIRKFIIGIGGSATSDCGLGMLQALGYVFCDADGQPVGPNGIDVERIVSVDDSHVLPELADCEFRIACDVNNPLYGDLGTPAIYGPQKGATPEIVARLDAAARSFAGVTARYCGHDWAHVAGAGAAGGLGFAFLAYLHGQLQSGIQIILDEISMPKYRTLTSSSPVKAAWTGKPPWAKPPSVWPSWARNTVPQSSPLQAASAKMRASAIQPASMPSSPFPTGPCPSKKP